MHYSLRLAAIKVFSREHAGFCTVLDVQLKDVYSEVQLVLTLAALHLRHLTFVPSTLGKLDIVRVCFKNANSPAAGPFHRHVDIGALGQTRDLRGWPGDPSRHSPGLYACKQLHQHHFQLMKLSQTVHVVLLASLGRSFLNSRNQIIY